MTNFSVEPLDATFGAIVTDIDLAHLDVQAFQVLYRVWLDNSLLIFPDQHLSLEDQQSFSERFGELEFPMDAITNVHDDGTPRIVDPEDELIKILRGNEGWHCDSTYMPVQSKCAIFSAHVAPASGGGTAWADMRAAYDGLSAAMKARIVPLKAYHSIRYSQAKIGHFYGDGDDHGDYDSYGMDIEPPLRPLVKIHPETGRTTLMIGRHAHAIPGLSADESEQLLSELSQFACQPPRVYEHSWCPGDVAVWDNRALMHRACPYDMHEPRIIYNCRIAGDPETEFAAHA